MFMNFMGQEFRQGTVGIALLCDIWGLNGQELELFGDLFTQMPRWLMLAVIWDLSWSCQLDHLHMASPYGLSFLTAWQSHSNRASYIVAQGSSTILPTNKVEVLSPFVTYCWKTHNVSSAVLYWLQASHKFTQLQGEGKYTLPLSGKSIKIIYRHVFKPLHWGILMNSLAFFSLTAESREGDIQSHLAQT